MTTKERFGVPSIQLMRAASSAVAALARQQFPHARRATVLCGKGNNGGDGMMAARLLADAGLEVTTLLLGAPEKLTGDAAIAYSELTSAKRGQIHVVTNSRTLAEHNDALNTELIVDAVLGTGFKPPIKGLALEALEWLQRGRARNLAPILAIDLPSGWPADETNATIVGPVFPADVVITFTAPKPAHVFGQLTRRWDQPVVVAPIGSPDESIVSALNIDWAGSSLSLAQAPRSAAANKGNFGHVLVVGGTFGSSGGKAGAPAMTALAAMRAGAGLVTAAVPTPALPVVASFAPELMTWPLTATRNGQIAAKNLEKKHIVELIAGKSVLAHRAGPRAGRGNGQIRRRTSWRDEDVGGRRRGCFEYPGREAGADQETGQGAHAGIDAPSGRDGAARGNDCRRGSGGRLETARNFARGFGVTLVLKGARTIIAHPDGRVAVNTSGNPGMAKGGSGDLLTGLIAGLLAQFPHDPARAVEAAVYLHGLAADLAVREGDEHTLLPTDSLAHLARAFQSRAHDFDEDGKNGYVWLQGRSMQQP